MSVTGSSSGIGLEMTRRVLENGDIAVATLRKPEALNGLSVQYGPDRLLVLKVDVAVRQDILDAFKKVQEVFGKHETTDLPGCQYSVLRCWMCQNACDSPLRVCLRA